MIINIPKSARTNLGTLDTPRSGDQLLLFRNGELYEIDLSPFALQEDLEILESDLNDAEAELIDHEIRITALEENPGGGTGAGSVPVENMTIEFNMNFSWNLGSETSDTIVNYLLEANLSLNIQTLPSTTTVGFTKTITFLQDSEGGNSVAWAGNIKWQSGVPPTVGDEPNEVTIVTLFWNGLFMTGSQSCGYL